MHWIAATHNSPTTNVHSKIQQYNQNYKPKLSQQITNNNFKSILMNTMDQFKIFQFLKIKCRNDISIEIKVYKVYC